MCGVVGYSGIGSSWARTKFLALCRESCIRGVHAFGIAYIDEQGQLIVKKSTNFAEILLAVPYPLPRKIIFHNRYCTSGDASKMENNQPIHVGGDALVFNGTIDMGTKKQMEERHGLKMFTENDGEIILRDFQDKVPLHHLNENVSFAGIYLSAEGEMIALRNEMRPLWLFDVDGGKFITSTKNIGFRAGLGSKAKGSSQEKELKPYTPLYL